MFCREGKGAGPRGILLCLFWFMIFAGSLGMGVGCGGGQKWYKPGHYQADYDLDRAECERIADSRARERSVSGDSVNIEVYTRELEQCMFSKGWSTKPPESPPGQGHDLLEPEKDHVACRVIGNQIEGLGHRVTLPAGFRLMNQQETTQGSTRYFSFLFQGPGPVFMNILFQEADDVSFEKTEFPVQKPNFSFDKSPEESDVKWESYCGKVGREWVGGVGAYYGISSTERIIFVITTPLPPENDSRPLELRLNQDQFLAMKEFSSKYGTWIGQAVTGTN